MLVLPVPAVPESRTLLPRKIALAAQHRVEPRNAGGNPLAGDLVLKPQRRDRQHRDAVLVDEEGILVGAVSEPRYFTTRRRRVEIWSLTRWSSRITQSETYSSRPWRVSVAVAALAGDDGGHALVLEPAEQAAQLGAQDGVVGQAGEQRLERVQHHALGADGVDRVTEPDEQSFQVVLAGLLDLAALDVDIVQHDFPALGQTFQVESERSDVFGQAPASFPRTT